VRSLKKDAAPPFRPVENQLEPTTKQLSIQIPEGMKTLADLGISSSIDFVAYVTPGGAAEKSGLRYGDRLVGLDGSPYNTGRIYGALDENPNAERTIAWIRDGVRQEGTYKQKFIPAGEAGDLGIKQDAYDKGFWGLMGTTVAPQKIPNPALVRNAFRHAVSETWSGIRLIGIGFKLLFQGRVSMRSIGGPLMIGQLAGQAGQMGLDSFFWMMALISLNLGLLNLLPIPVLDGGQVVLIGIESITRRPISNTIKEKVMLVGVAMLVLLMIFATWNDISRLIIG
jgi:regulator of sigma E protease